MVDVRREGLRGPRRTGVHGVGVGAAGVTASEHISRFLTQVTERIETSLSNRRGGSCRVGEKVRKSIFTLGFGCPEQPGAPEGVRDPGPSLHVCVASISSRPSLSCGHCCLVSRLPEATPSRACWMETRAASRPPSSLTPFI